MEEVILKIIESNPVYTKFGATDAAKEITSMLKEFILWLSLNTHIATTYSPMYYYYKGKGKRRHLDLTKEHHITDIFDYWKTNIDKS